MHAGIGDVRLSQSSEPVPPRGVATTVAPGIRRLVAANAGPMTYHGTNTYLLDWNGGVLVIDPGPDDAVHVGHILGQAGAPISGIVLTHGHHDHWGALPALKAATGAPVHGWHQPFAPEVRPDVALKDGDRVGPLRAVFTPGHAPDHLCFMQGDGTLFSGDVVMGWSTTVIGGRGGDMAAYFGSLDRLLATESALYLPGHGPPLPKPRAYVSALRGHRSFREASILTALGKAPTTLAGLTDQLYPGLDSALRGAAEANVSAHLDKLEAEGRAMPSEMGWTVPA